MATVVTSSATQSASHPTTFLTTKSLRGFARTYEILVWSCVLSP